MDDTYRAYIEINLGNLEHNVNILRGAMPPQCELMAVVKANAYGHGMYEIAVNLNRMGVRAFAAATIGEGIRLRQFGVTGEILILGYTPPVRAEDLHKYDLTQTLIGHEYADSLNAQGFKIKVHVKIDTGMHRLGFGKEENESIAAVFSMKNFQVTGIYTHLCSADCPDEENIRFTQRQIKNFHEVLDLLKEKKIRISKVHIQSSYGLMNYPELHCDYVRAGVFLYGVKSLPHDTTKLQPDLRPVLSLKSKVILIRKIPKGDSVGYGRSYVAERDSVIAILPIGYADGYPRSLSDGKGSVLIDGRFAPIVGKICMDQLAVDVTEIPRIKVGMTATLIGREGEK